MKNIIKISESDLVKLLTKVLSEQSFPGTSSIENMGYKERATPKPKKPIVKTKENINPKNLKLGDGGKKSPKLTNDVKILQQKLMDLGLLKTDTMIPTGFFGPKTDEALKKYYGVSDSTKTTTTSKTEAQPQTSKAAKNTAKCETGTDLVLKPGASLLFDGDKLYWYTDGKLVKSWNAVSGLTWKNTPPTQWGEMMKRYVSNREEWAKDKNAGPLPEGTYNAGPLQTRSGQPEEIGALEAFWYKLTGQVGDSEGDRAFCKNTILSRISWGNYRMGIEPTGNQKMYGRGDFYIHGGSLGGSHGCIDLTDDMEDFAKFFGIWSSANKKQKIPLTVKYKNPAINTIIQKLINLF